MSNKLNNYTHESVNYLVCMKGLPKGGGGGGGGAIMYTGSVVY